MPTFIIKLQRGDQARYMMWSTISDAPTTYGMTRDELEDWVRERYGQEGLRWLPERLERVERTGTSCLDGTPVESLISLNRAGPREAELSQEEIWQAFVVDRDKNLW